MAGKEPKQEGGRKEAEVDFFGDSNVDWLSDEDERAAAAARAAASVPPPPPPTLRTATPLAGNLDDRAWANRLRTPAPSTLSTQPTIVFSDVPTLPPIDSPLDGAAPSSPPPALDLRDRAADAWDEAPISDPEPSMTEAETVEVTHARALPALDAPTGPTETIQVPGPATLLLQSGGRQIAVPTGPVTDPGSDPGSDGSSDGGGDPVTEQAPRPAAGPEPVDTVETIRLPLQPRPAAGITPRAPSPPPTSWLEVVALLDVERAAAEPFEVAGFCWAAGLISLRMAQAPAEADRWFDLARQAGLDAPDLHRRQAEARAALGRFPEQEQSLVALARASEGVDRAEAWLEAGLVAWRRLDRPAVAVDHFQEAARTLPDDYTSRALLRALLPGLGREHARRRFELLAEVAALSEGGIRADALVERAIVADELGLPHDAVQALTAALEAEPGHTFAFQRLERALLATPTELAALRAREAARWDQPDPGYWRWREASALRAAGDESAALDALEAAIAAGWPCEREREAALQALGRTDRAEALLARALEATRGPGGPDTATTAFRLAVVREQRGDVALALEAYRACLDADPTAFPAADAVARLSRRAGAETAQGWRDRLATADPAETGAIALRVAELEIAAQDWAAARAALDGLVASSEGSLEREVALDLLDLVLAAEGAVEPLRALRRRRAEQTWDLGERVAWLLLAASRPDDDPAATALLEAALDTRADHPAALAALAEAEAGERFLERLRRAAVASEDPARRAALSYRVARALADELVETGGDEADARTFAEAALAAGPSVAASWLLRSLGGDRASEAAHYRAAAEDPARRRWGSFAAAVWEPDAGTARQDLDRLLAEHADHPGASALLEAQLWRAADQEAVVDLYQSTGGDAPVDLVRNAVLLTELGRTEEAVLVLRRLRAAPAGTPLRPAARVAVELGMADLAAEILAWSESAEDRTERARLLAGLGRASDALPLLVSLSGSGPERVGVSARLATVAQQAGAHDAMIAAYATLAHEATSASLRAAYGAWTAMQLHAAGRDREALEPWRVALAERPTSTGALLGAARSLVARKDGEGLRRLFAMLRPEEVELVVETTWLAGDRAGAADAAARAAPPERGRRLANELVAERLREELAAAQNTAAAWQAAYDAIGRRRDHARTPSALDDAEARRRWILREKLASTEAAWDLYRALHAQSPGDAEVAEALARIATARGDVPTAIGYLESLANRATDRADAARYRRRIGEAREQVGDVAGARQAYLDALDHLPDDSDALRALRRLAESTGDWSAVVAILQRQVALVSPDRQLELRREIARVTEAHAEDALVAIDAWRAVLETTPEDPEGLDHLVALAESRGQWGVFVDAGQLRVKSLAGAERSELLRRLGFAALDHLDRDDGVRFLQDAASGEVPDLVSVIRLEQHARARADWPGVARMLLLQARLEPGRRERVDALLRAARIQHDALHVPDEAAATYQQILGLEPDHEPALRYLAAFLYEKDRAAEALPVCARLEPLVERGQDLDDFDTRMELANFWFYHAEVLRKAGREEEATPRYARALELNPSHVPSLEAVGPLYLAAEQWGPAEGVYRQLLQLSGGQGDKTRVAGIYTQLGLVERKLGQQEKAYKRFSKALELQPNHVGALKGMALVLEDRQDWSNLLNVYNNVIYHASQPDDVIDAYMTKGRILDDQMQRQDKAAQHYQRSLDFDAAQPHAYLRLAELAMRRDAFQEAGELVDRAFGLEQDLVDPWRARLLLARAAAWQSTGRGPEAERCVREARMRDVELVAPLGDAPLADLEALRRALKDALPKA